MLLGYNTNGLAHHDPFQAIELLAVVGYRSVALTLDHGPLNPFSADWPAQQLKLRAVLDRLQLRSVIETGARFLLDPRIKHEPTLISKNLQAVKRRIEFLHRAIDAAAMLGSDCVSLWSGIARDDVSADELWERLSGGLVKVLAYARQRGIAVGFEPEPGMFIDTLDRFGELRDRLGADDLMLTLDVGHLHCLGEVPIPEKIVRWGPLLVNVHLEDMRRGTHEHLMFGEGEMDFPPIIEALAAAGYRGGIHVELSRHSHDAPRAIRQAYEFLHPLVNRYAAG